MNPALPGFHPDPSIVRVDGTYYLVTSTFEYLPGLPVHRSTDLVSWELIGHVAVRPEQLGLDDVPTPGGTWAPTIRHRDGTFFVVVTVMLGGRGCVVFSATDPAGPWSDGVPVPAVEGIDPDLAWDDDGTALITFAGFPHPIRQVPVDLSTGQALGPVREIWAGTGAFAPEGPHLYRRGGHWYLLVAEGGTDRGHRVSIARGPSPSGPWAAAPGNPVLTAVGTEHAVQNTGHADLVDTPDGGTAMVLLGVRPLGFANAFSPLGRETFLVPVTWVDGWPQASLPEATGTPDEDVAGGDDWIAVRRTPSSLLGGDGLVLTGEGTTLADRRPVFVGRPQRHLGCTVDVVVDASAGRGGLAARHDEQHWFGLEATTDGDRTVVTARAVLAGLESTWTAAFPAGPVQLRIEQQLPPGGFVPAAVGGGVVRMLAAWADADPVLLAEFDGRYWSYEVAKSFTGRVWGLFAVDGTVSFTDLRYRGSDSA
ncbi:glycoside hydrolase family 43 protein [Klenkia terrae]|uniref:glycoside hydrolase family 43 protein n=1 Tax=Klenkia terrae TaxID=1052259 RepID=UPI001CD86C37|nr:glycoside hydrolase family 43 protein [Klenkia terrae]